jgi:hypothetical protein
MTVRTPAVTRHGSGLDQRNRDRQANSSTAIL